MGSLGTAFFIASNLAAVVGSVERSKLGVASGVRFTMGSCGQGLSLVMLGAIAALRLGPTGGRAILLGETGGHTSAHAFAAGYGKAMLVGAGLALIGVVASLAGGRSGKARSLGIAGRPAALSLIPSMRTTRPSDGWCD